MWDIEVLKDSKGEQMELEQFHIRTTYRILNKLENAWVEQARKTNDNGNYKNDITIAD